VLGAWCVVGRGRGRESWGLSDESVGENLGGLGVVGMGEYRLDGERRK